MSDTPKRHRYVIGDIHGRWNTLRRLLDVIEAENEGVALEYWLVGDLVNVGPDSAKVVRWAREQTNVRCVLGNHDLHMLAVAAHKAKMRRKDTFQDLLEADDAHESITWLRKQHIAYREDAFLMVHAGILPNWDAEDAVRIAGELERELGADHGWESFFDDMYGDKPRRWSEDLKGAKRRRCAINAFTRMRALFDDGRMEFEFKGEFQNMPGGRRAWFELHHILGDVTLLFGHWSALNFRVYRDGEFDELSGAIDFPAVICLDSGCAWERELTALGLDDGRVIQMPVEHTIEEPKTHDPTPL